ncbi:STAS domain-containing protein [Actinophytocola sp.]|uniref:STAS domain-containing protein n=1 Tax=Actinophytocola sp. TaxID=1872138 RepID=UPI0025BEE247|nr:STAS domain-containing protein [Actinophytocola sp.]
MSFRADPPTPGGFSVRVDNHGETVVVSVAGDVDLATAPELGESISTVLERRPGLLVVDLSEVSFLASAGMSVLIAADQQSGEHTRFRVVAAGNATFRPMELTGLTEMFSIYPTRDQALRQD